MLYQIKPGKVVVDDGKTETPVPLLGWTSQPDLALSVLCHALGEKPSRKQLDKERFRAAKFLSGFRRQFAHGLDFFPGQKVDGNEIKIWLLRQGAPVS